MVKGPGTVILTAFFVWARKKLQILDLYRVLPANLSDDARHRIGVSRAVERVPGLSMSTPSSAGGETVGVALAPDLAIGDDIQARVLLGADGEQRRVFLTLRREAHRGCATALSRALAAESARRASCGSISHSGCG